MAGAQGLGELYAEEFVAAKTGGAAEDKQEGARKEARALVAALTARLDALSHFHFAPKPIVEDLAVRADVPALALEEVAPQARPAQPGNVSGRGPWCDSARCCEWPGAWTPHAAAVMPHGSARCSTAISLTCTYR